MDIVWNKAWIPLVLAAALWVEWVRRRRLILTECPQSCDTSDDVKKVCAKHRLVTSLAAYDEGIS